MAHNQVLELREKEQETPALLGGMTFTDNATEGIASFSQSDISSDNTIDTNKVPG